MTEKIRGLWEKTEHIYPWVYGFGFLTKHLRINRKNQTIIMQARNLKNFFYALRWSNFELIFCGMIQ